MTNYRYLGYGVTDSNGVAKLDHDANGDPLTHSYTGVGAGEIDVVASLDNPVSSGSIVSGTFNVWDTQWYDKALDGKGNHNDNYNSITNLTRASDGTTFSMPSAWTQLMPKINNSTNISISDDLYVEFTVLALDNQGGQVRFTVYDGSNRVTVLSATGHYKAVLTDDIKIYKDDNPTPINTLELSKSLGYVQLIFTNSIANASMKFKDYMIYPI